MIPENWVVRKIQEEKQKAAVFKIAPFYFPEKENRMPIFINKTFVNKNEGYRLGETDVEETLYEKKSELFLDLQREHGRCTSKVMIDQEAGKSVAIGWVFEKGKMYSDTKQTYIQETWVTLHTQPPEKSINYHYLEI